jgi:deazaflavin-dependent oxidoreductase (nitroreductase family)
MTEGMDVAAFNGKLIEAFRASAGVGELGPVNFQNLVLLTTTGRRSGEPRTVPLGAARDELDNLLLLASNMGAPRHPDWFRNLESDPHVTVEITGASFEADAEILAGEDREAAYQRWVAMAPHVADHQDKAGREIPLVRIPPPAG